MGVLIGIMIVREVGLPLPLFFQWDDIEFGYRARAHGFPTVALPGAGIWHADEVERLGRVGTATSTCATG